MITVIASTNRPDSMTEIVAGKYFELVKSKVDDAKYFSLKQITAEFLHPQMYEKKHEAMIALVEEFIAPADKLVFIIPEYNGSYPGILKCFLDMVHPKYFREKKAGIIGLSDGHAGNLRGQEHLTGVLNHLRMLVHFAQPKLSDIDKMMDENGEINDERVLRLLNDHAERMINF